MADELGPPAKEPWKQPPREFPKPLDLTYVPEGQPFLVRTGSGFEWREGKLIVLFQLPGGPVLHHALESEQSRQLLEWMLRGVEAAGG